MKKILCLFTVFAAFLTTTVQAHIYDFKVPDQNMRLLTGFNGESLFNSTEPDTIFVFCTDDENDNTAYITRNLYVWGQGWVYNDTLWKTTLTPEGKIKKHVRPMIKFPLPEGTFSSSAQVGDLMTFPDGSQGIVCYVDPNDNQKGWVVDLYDIEGTHQIWNSINPIDHDYSKVPRRKPVHPHPSLPNYYAQNHYSHQFDLADWIQDGKGDTDSLYNAEEGKSEDELVGRNPNVGNSYIPTIKPGNLTITPGTFSITATGYEGMYDGDSHAGTVTVPSDITATLSYSTDGGNTWVSTAPTAKDVADSKTVQVKASAEGYLDATASYALTVTPAPVTVTANEASKQYGEPDPEFSAVVTGTIGTDVITFTVSRPGAGSFVYERVDTYRNAIVPAGPTLQGNYTVTYDSADFTITLSDSMVLTVYDYYGVYDGLFHGEPASVNVTDAEIKYRRDLSAEPEDFAPTIKNVGSITVTATATSLFYTQKTATYTLQVIPAPLTIITGSDSMTYDGTTLTKGGEMSGLVDGEFATFTVTGSQTNAGSSDNTYSLEWDGNAINLNYTVNDSIGTLTVAKRNVTLTSASDEKVYDGTPLTNSTVTVDGDGFANGEGATYNVTGSQTDTGSSANAFTYTLNDGTLAGNYEITKTEGTLTVTNNTTAITLTAGSANKTYDGTALTNSDFTSTGLPAGFTAEVTMTTASTITNAGSQANVIDSYVIKNSAGEDKTAYFTNVTTENGTLTVNPATVTITTGSASKEYDGSPLTKDEASIAGLVNNETANVTATGSQTEVGSSSNTYSLTWGTAAASNYTVTEHLGTLTVTENAAPITLTAASDSKTYDGTALTNSDFTSTGLPAGFTAEVTMTTASTITNAGSQANVIDSYVIKNSAGEDKTAYFTNVTTENGTLTVNRRPVHVTANEASKQYGEPDPEFSAVVSGTIGTDVISYTVTRPGAGSFAYERVDTFHYAIVPAGDTLQGNYTVTYVSADFIITPSDSLVLTVYDYNGVYDGLEHGNPATVNVTLGTTITYSRESIISASFNAPKIKDVGTITVTARAENPNYTTKTAIYTLQVTPAPLTITTGSDSKTYDGTPLTKDGVMTGLVNGETATFSVTGFQTNAGTSPNTYSIAWNGTADSNNYTVNETIGTLTVAPKAVTVKAENASKMCGTADPTFTAQVTGTIGTDVITYTVTRPGVGTDEAVGTYPNAIVPAGPTLQGNYTVTYDSANFTITPSDALVLTVYDYNGEYDGLVHGEPASVTVTDATITYSTDDGATWSTTVPEIKDVGTITVNAKATHPNYTTKTATYTLQVTPAPLTITTGSASKGYDGTPLTQDGVMTGLVNGETATFTVTGSQTNAGTSTNTYSLTWDGTAKPSNYAIQVLGLGSLSVYPKKIHVRADNKHKKCGNDDPVFTFIIENLSTLYPSLPVNDSQSLLENEGITPYIFSYTIDREETEYIGTYDIIPSVKYDGIDDPGNYVFTYDYGKLFVDAKDSTTIRIVCENELPYLWEGVLFDSASTKQVQVTAADGCVTLLKMILLTSQPEYIGDTTVVIVNTDGTTPNGYTWHGTTYTEPGTYAYNLLDGLGCLIDILHLVVLDVDTTIGNICPGGSTEISINVTKRPATATSNLIPRVPQLGDVLCTDGYTMSIYDFIGSGKTAKGVVVQVDAEDGYGRAISLHDTTDLPWVGASSYYNYVNPNAAAFWHQAITDMGGDTNTRIMVGVDWSIQIPGPTISYWSFPSQEQMSNRSPAACACAYYNGTSPSLSSNNRDARWLGWYLPAAGEMMLAFANRTEINKTLSELHNLNSDYQPLSNCDYWTSTKGGTSYRSAWYITSDGNLRHATSTEKKAVRPFIKFQIK